MKALRFIGRSLAYYTVGYLAFVAIVFVCATAYYTVLEIL